MYVSPSLWTEEIAAGLDFWVSEDHRILNIKDVFNKYCRCLAHDLVQIMHFSLHAVEISPHSICQQPEQLSQCWNNMKSAAFSLPCCWYPWLSFSLNHQTGRWAERRGQKQTKCWPGACVPGALMDKLLGADSSTSFLVSAPLSSSTYATAWQDSWFLRIQTRKVVIFGLFTQFLLFLRKSLFHLS